MVIIIAKSPLSIYFSTFLYTVVIIETDSSAIGMRADKKKGGAKPPLYVLIPSGKISSLNYLQGLPPVI